MDEKLKPSVTIVTLGVDDMPAMPAFYERLGLAASQASNAHVTFFQLPTLVLSLYGRDALAEDATVKAGQASAFKGFTLAWNTSSRDEVDRIMKHAEDAGARIRKAAQEVFWGGYSGYFADPEDNLWEAAHNPFFPFDDRGVLQLP